MTKKYKSVGAKGSWHDAYIESEEGLEYYDHVTARFFKPLSYIYAHGELEEDLGTDLIREYRFTDTMGELRNGKTAYYTKVNQDGTFETKLVKYYLYRHPQFGHLTGVCIYADDKQAREYAEKLIEERPNRF